MSPMPNFSDEDLTPECSPRHVPSTTRSETKEIPVDSDVVPNALIIDNKKIEVENRNTTSIVNGNDNKENTCNNVPNKNENRLSVGEVKAFEQSAEIGIEITENSNCDLNGKTDSEQVCRESSSETIQDTNVCNTLLYLAQLKNETCGFPLRIFYQGYLCLPYLSLPYLDLLSDVNVRGYLVGATNVLFKQKRQLYDILVDIDAGRIECQDVELRKQLHLTTEDLRYLSKLYFAIKMSGIYRARVAAIVRYPTFVGRGERGCIADTIVSCVFARSLISQFDYCLYQFEDCLFQFEDRLNI